MATGIGKIHCVKCGKDKATLRCGGCLQEFCNKHLEDHRQELNKQLDEIEVSRDVFRQTLTEQMEHPKTHILMQQIDEWECDSIKKIKQTAAETREILLKNTNEYVHQIEIDLNKLTNQLRESRAEHDFNEISLRQFQEELERLTKNLTKPSNISIQEDSTPFITKICIDRCGKYVTVILVDIRITIFKHFITLKNIVLFSIFLRC